MDICPTCDMQYQYLSGQRYCPTCDFACKHEEITYDGREFYSCKRCPSRFVLTGGGLREV